MTECGLEAACKWDAYCHAHQPPIPFIRTETRGLFGTIFCDFGPAFTVFDLDGT
jgi:ubiquitin-activating enzyme E1